MRSCIWFLLGWAVFAQAPATPAFRIERLADGVYAAIATRPPGQLVEANHLFIINDSDVVVVDADFSPALTREALAELRKLTPKPVGAVVNTHWHDDHILGNAVYRQAFPGVEFIAHREALTYLPGQGVANRAAMLKNGAPYVQQMRESLAKGLTVSGTPISDEERAAYAADIGQWSPYEAATPTLDVVLPTRPVDNELVLTRGTRTIEIRHLGRGHTAGDLIVYLPNERIVATGDLVIAPVPLIGGDQSYVGDWAETLDRTLALGATTIVPGHGPVMHDDAFARQTVALLRALETQTEAAIGRGDTKEDAVKSIHVEDIQRAMAGDSPLLNSLFRGYVIGPAVTAVYRERK
jgi:cyclase